MKAMIVSVGGTVEPIIFSLTQHRPEFVCFFASQESLDKIGDIKKGVSDQGHVFQDYKVTCDDASDLTHCYERAGECAEKIRESGYSAEDVLVDYTGGTKSMTAALGLATIGHGYSFSYVAGTERTKEGLGVVVTGTEKILQGVSPWRIFAVEERKRISLFVSAFQYEAAIVTISATRGSLSERDLELWDALEGVLRGYLAWDSFDHTEALRQLTSGVSRLELCCKIGGWKGLFGFLETAQENLSALKEMAFNTKGFKNMHPVMIRDLVSNAHRRYRQNKYDDAVARLYRAVEMAGQIAFEEAVGCPNSKAHPEKIPETLREEYRARYGDPKAGVLLKIPLFGTFRVLRELGHSLAESYSAHEEEIMKILSTRNSSILAHGIQPVKKETCEKFMQIVKDLVVEGSLIEFPELHW